MSDQTRREEAIREKAREDVRMGRIPNSPFHSHTIDHHIFVTAAQEVTKK